jgi:hypothetical protein
VDSPARPGPREARRETGYSYDHVGDISDPGLEALLWYAHKASFLREEGRPTLGRFYVPERPVKED